MSRLLTVKEVAERLRVSTTAVKRLPVPKIRIGRLWRYEEEDLVRYVREHKFYPQEPGQAKPRRTVGLAESRYTDLAGY